MAIYDKPVWGLFLDFLGERDLNKDEILTRQEVVDWFEKNYPKIKKGTISAHLILYSINWSGSDQVNYLNDRTNHLKIMPFKVLECPFYHQKGYSKKFLR